MVARVTVNPTTRTIAYLEARGWLVDIVERRERYATFDCFGCWDILALKPGAILFVQCTSAPNIAARITKCRANENTPGLLRCGATLQVWGWWTEKPEPRIERIEAVASEVAK